MRNLFAMFQRKVIDPGPQAMAPALDQGSLPPAAPETPVSAAMPQASMLVDFESVEPAPPPVERSGPAPMYPPLEPIYLEVPSRDSDKVQALGAVWDKNRMRWTVPPLKDPKPFARWLPWNTPDPLPVLLPPPPRKVTARTPNSKVVEAVELPPINEEICHLEAQAYAPDASARKELAEHLGGLGSSAIPLLARLARDPDRDTRAKVAESLGRVGTAGLPYIGRLARDERAFVRLAAARALGSMGPDGLSYLEDLAADRIEPVQEAARASLAELGEGALPLAAEWAKSKNAAQTRAGVALLAGAPASRKTSPEILDVLLKVASIKRNHPILAAIPKELEEGIARHGTRLQFADLIPLLEHPLAGVRAGAVRVLGQKGGGALSILQTCLDTRAVADTHVKIRAAEAMASIRQDSPAFLVELSLRQEWECRAVAASRMMQLTGVSLPLERMAEDSSPKVREAMARALPHAKSISEIRHPLLLLSMDHENPVVGEAIGQKLLESLEKGEGYDKDIRPVLGQLAANVSPRARKLAADALAYYGEDGIKPLVLLVKNTFAFDANAGERPEAENAVAAGLASLRRLGAAALPALRELSTLEARTWTQNVFKAHVTQAINDIRGLPAATA